MTHMRFRFLRSSFIPAIAIAVLSSVAGAQATFQRLGYPPGSQAFGVSGNGSVIVGRYPSVNPAAYDEACRWTNTAPAAPTAQGLGFTPGTDDSLAFAVSGDGSIIVGASGEFTYDVGTAFRYQNGQMQSLGLLPGGAEYSIANDIS